MRYIITHATDARWEAGMTPSKELVANVGTLLREMARAGALIGGEGLRATSEGVRLDMSGGRRTVVPGPYTGSNELTDGFAIVKVRDIDQAIEWAARFAETAGDTQIDVRPVTEPWDIGMMPKPPALETTRFMLLRKADRASESGRTLAQRKALERLLGEMSDAGVLVASEMLAPSARGRRYKLSDGKRSVIDGPFTESKELIAGYVHFHAGSFEDAAAWAPRYQDTVESPSVELREVEELEQPAPAGRT
jgi:hypothetical protein